VSGRSLAPKTALHLRDRRLSMRVESWARFAQAIVARNFRQAASGERFQLARRLTPTPPPSRSGRKG